MKVLHLISSAGMYGAEAVILNLSRALNATGQHQSILGVFDNSTAPNHQLHDAALADGLEAYLIPCRGQLDLSVPASIRGFVQETHADLIHAHGYKADIYSYLARRGAGVPLVSTCHNWIEDELTVRLYGAIDRRVLRGFNGVVAVSTEVRDRLVKAGVASERIRLIRNGIDLGPFRHVQTIRDQRSQETSAVRVGLVARLSQEKGVDIFLRAASEVLRRHPNTEFVVAGEGPDRASLEALIAELGIKQKLTLLGHTTDMPAFYSSIDMLVSASRLEGLPMVLLEAMASGLAPVATAVGAVPHLVRNSETGLLVQPNDPSALAAAIEQLIQDPQLRRNLGENAQQLIAREYSAERMATEYLELYGRARAERDPDSE